MNTVMAAPGQGSDDFASLEFAINQVLSRVNTATLVKIISCTNSGGLTQVGTVDVQPLINMLDGEGNGHPLAPLYNLPYLRVQGGANAIILDPQVGDIGIAVFASRDITKVKSTKAQANPGSWAVHSMSDGLYLGGVLNGVPTQYIQFANSGITLHSATSVTISAPSIVLDGLVQQGTGANGGNATFGGTITATGNVTGAGISLNTHHHSDPQGGNTGGPA